MNSLVKNKPAADPFDSTRDTMAKVREQLEAGTYTFQAWLTVVSATYTWDWKHQLFLYKQLDRVTSGEINRLQIAMPPRHTKSETVTVRYAAWRLEQNPSLRIVIGAYNQKLANKFSRKIRRLLHGRIEFSTDCKAVEEWETLAGGGIRAIGVGSGITGYGADLIIIDDPVKSRKQAESETYRDNTWEWFGDDLYTRLEPGGQIILIQCMVGETPVLMSDGTEKPLKNIKVGDVVATYDNGQLSTSKVLNWKNQGSDYIYAIKMKSGIIVKANERHPFLVCRNGVTEWIRLRNLKTGDKVVSVMRSGEHIEESNVLLTDAINPQNVKDIVTPTTAKLDGQADTDRRQLIRHQDAPHICDTDTALTSMSITKSSTDKGENVLFVSNRLPQTSALIGAASSALTTTTPQEKLEDYYATIATSQSDTENQKKFYSKPLNTCEITQDEIVEITESGCEDVFDIQVERTENFIANGLVSHNTRWHDDDLSGRLQKEMLEEDGEHWEIVSLPALAEENDPLGRKIGEALCPERYDEEALAKRKKKLGAYSFAALFQQRPIPSEGGLFKFSWFGKDTIKEKAPDGLRWARGYDLAISQRTSADYTASFRCAFDKEGNLWIADGFCKRIEYPEQKRYVIARMKAEGRTEHGIEKALHGIALVQDLRRVESIRAVALRAVPVDADKYTRALPWANLAEEGKLFFVRGTGSWIRELIEELIVFTGKGDTHDDRVDAISVAVQMLSKRSRKGYGF